MVRSPFYGLAVLAVCVAALPHAQAAVASSSVSGTPSTLPNIRCAPQVCPPTPIPTRRATPTPQPRHTPIKKGYPLNPPTQGYNYHTDWQWSTNFFNLYAQVNTSGLSVNPSDPVGFLTNEIWRTDGQNAALWQEIGYVGGQLMVGGNNVYYTGIFAAYNESSSGYIEIPITESPQPYQPRFYGAWVALSVQTGDAHYVDLNYNNTTYGTDY